MRLFVRRDAYGRFLSCLVYLPRDRYTTAGPAEQMQEILRRELDGESVDYTARVTESVLARVHFVVRPSRGEPSATSTPAGSSAQLAEATRSWRDDFVAARPRSVGEEEGVAARARATPTRSRRRTRRTTRRDRRGRTCAAGARRGPRTAWRLSLYQPDGRRSRRARGSRCSGSARRCRCATCCRCCSAMGVEVVDERPYELERADGGSRTSTTSGCATPRALPATAAARAVPGRVHRGLGGAQRERRLQRAGAARPG